MNSKVAPFLNRRNPPESRGIPLVAKRSTARSCEFDRLLLTRLSQNFVLRDFMFSSVAAQMGAVNVPEDSEAVIRAGRDLCERILEPIQRQFGRFAITFGYQCREAIEAGIPASKNHRAVKSSAPHMWDRKTFGDETYARVDILPYCVEDGRIPKLEFGRWVMHTLDVCLLMTWTKSNVHCLTISPRPRRVWLEWGRPKTGECRQTVFMGADYWQRIYPSLPASERPKFGPSHTGGLMWWTESSR